MNPEDIYAGIEKRRIRAISKAITLIESTAQNDEEQASALLSKLMATPSDSIRIGISGVPGVGKSTWIESFGLAMAERGHRIGVLAVDPSSPIKGGSIMGDKTRMEKLAVHPNVFIRPSPSGCELGGVAKRTREAITILEAAGFDLILVETVGVGQSEVVVSSMVDFFLMLQIPNAGDELQGIKKGVLELADLVAINKYDGDHKLAAEITANQHRRALSLVRADRPVKVVPCSGLTGTGLDDIAKTLFENLEARKANGDFAKRRRDQNLLWFDKCIDQLILRRVKSTPNWQTSYLAIRDHVLAGDLHSDRAARQLVDSALNQDLNS